MEKMLLDSREDAVALPDTLFLDCYMELLAYTAYILRDGAGGALTFEEAAATFTNLVQRSREMATDAGFTEDQWREGFFPVCAYIDETLLCSAWPGSAQWGGHQFQRTYYHTTNAGWLFFENLDKLDETDFGIRSVYEFCLALGFKGRYFQTSDVGKMEDIKYTHLKGVTENLDLVFPETPFPEAYESESAAGERRKNRWKRYSFFLPAAVLPPLVIFIVLYVVFDRLLDNTIARYFNTVL